MSGLTTMNLFMEDMRKLDRERLQHAASKGEHVTWPKYLSYITEVIEHVGKCDRCKTIVHKCMKKE